MDNNDYISVKNQKKKDRIKNIIIVFLLVLLVLTFFSNTIMNYSLPQVSVTRLSSGVVVKSAEISASAEASQEHAVLAENDVEIKRTAVKTGQKVKEGQVLFYLKSSEESSEAVELRKTIDEAKLSYAKALLVAGNDYFDLKQSVSMARDALSEAIAARDSFDPSAASASAEKLMLLNERLSILERDKNALDSGNPEGLSEGSKNVIGSDILNGYCKAKKEYEDAAMKLEQLENSYAGDSAWTEAQRKLNEQKIKLERLKEDNADKRTIEDEQTQLDYAAADFETINSIKENIASAGTVLTQKESAYRSQSAAESKINSLKSQIEAEMASVSAEINALGSSSPNQFGSDQAALEKDVREKQYALDSAVHALETQIKNDNIEDSKTNMDLDSEKKKIEEQEAEYAKLVDKNGKTEITSPVDGVVGTIEAMSGTPVMKGETLLTINVLESGFCAKATVKNDIARSLSVGKSYSVKDDDNTKVKLSKVSKSKQDSKSSDLEFDITGDVDDGSMLTILLNEESRRMDNVVPKNAVKEDSSGKFVYAVRSKHTPIGNRYIAVKVPVTVDSEDDSQCSVSGDFGENADYIITASSKPFTSGFQVKIAEG